MHGTLVLVMTRHCHGRTWWTSTDIASHYHSIAFAQETVIQQQVYFYKDTRWPQFWILTFDDDSMVHTQKAVTWLRWSLSRSHELLAQHVNVVAVQETSLWVDASGYHYTLCVFKLHGTLECWWRHVVVTVIGNEHLPTLPLIVSPSHKKQW